MKSPRTVSTVAASSSNPSPAKSSAMKLSRSSISGSRSGFWEAAIFIISTMISCRALTRRVSSAICRVGLASFTGVRFRIRVILRGHRDHAFTRRQTGFC